MYDTGSVKVIATSSEISREDDTLNVNHRVDEVPKSNSGTKKRQKFVSDQEEAIQESWEKKITAKYFNQKR